MCVCCVSVVSCESPVMARQYQCQTDTSDTWYGRRDGVKNREGT